MRKYLLLGASCTFLITSAGFADNLLQVYHQALLNDPVYAQAESTWHSQQMNLPIARAGYFPQLGLSGDATRNYKDTQPPSSPSSNGYTWQYGYSLSLTQPIFNLATWNSIKGAGATVKAATATYLAAEQSLIQRTANAYFNVLQAYDQLRYTVSNKRAVYQQLVTAQQKFKVGLIANTDVYDARSEYDQVVAQEIASQNNLNIQLENLRAITGQHYVSLNSLGKKLPLLKPRPANIDRWVTIANKQNYGLKAQSYAVLAAMRTVKKTAAGGYPSLNLTGGFSESHIEGRASAHVTDEAANLGVALSYQPIQGGLVLASTKQARYDYVTASGKLEEVHRNVVNQTRSSYLSVLSGISQIKADRQRIISARNALSATKAGFSVGTRTMVDVLNDLSTLYQAQQKYADDQYAYLNNLIDLKAAAGTLKVSDLLQINSWLDRSVYLPKQGKLVTPLKRLEGVGRIDKRSLKKSSVTKQKKLVVKHHKKAAAVVAKKSIALPSPE